MSLSLVTFHVTRPHNHERVRMMTRYTTGIPRQANSNAIARSGRPRGSTTRVWKANCAAVVLTHRERGSVGRLYGHFNSLAGAWTRGVNEVNDAICFTGRRTGGTSILQPASRPAGTSCSEWCGGASSEAEGRCGRHALCGSIYRLIPCTSPTRRVERRPCICNRVCLSARVAVVAFSHKHEGQ
ncbi:hypothetical protein K461DRAFT_274160 [Myriangium duriaei CBS 260.36]|uniref:Uncharacterized protein n=1 Tax=Myriangium duriaei CBS 260.36 TaxID=1168546 RepID=A0A9P4MK72_9PEZI|nr:hypothetical protein K461DRAFT_274160 [Myriangium duriaei CBS 260.36]